MFDNLAKIEGQLNTSLLDWDPPPREAVRWLIVVIARLNVQLQAHHDGLGSTENNCAYCFFARKQMEHPS